MAEIALLFHAERWLSDWFDVGGLVGIIDIDGEPTWEVTAPALPPLGRSWDEWFHKAEALHKMIQHPPARAAMVNYLERRRATEGQG
jgi:hypothetical protein